MGHSFEPLTEMTRARNINWNKLPKIDPGKKVVYPNPYPKPPNGEKTGGENTDGATTTVVLLTEGRILQVLGYIVRLKQFGLPRSSLKYS
jgi:hypothetical protein